MKYIDKLLEVALNQNHKANTAEFGESLNPTVSFTAVHCLL